MRLLANVYANRRKFADAEGLLAAITETNRRRFGPDHSDTLRYSLDLAATYLLDGKLDKAEPLAVDVVERRRRLLGSSAPETISSMLILGSIYEQRQKFPQGLAVANSAWESSRRALGENNTTTLGAKALYQRLQLKVPNAAPGKATRRGELETRAQAIDNYNATSLPEMIALAAQRATVAVNQNKPEEGIPPLLEAIEAARRAGQEELSLISILAGIYARQKKYEEAETTLRKVLEKPPSALNGLMPNVLPFALRSMGTGYRNDGKFAQAEPYFVRLAPLMLATPGETNPQTQIDMFLLADNYSSERKYEDAEKAFNQLLAVQRRVAGPDAMNTVVTISNIGWARLQQKRYAEAEATFREATAILMRTAPDAWERFNVESMLGAALAGQKKFDDAEPLLISGHNGMGSGRPSTNATVASRFTRDQAGEAILQLYADWSKPAKQAEWTEKLRR
jgi:tetratricopeptide (TPR) repeat protein